VVVEEIFDDVGTCELVVLRGVVYCSTVVAVLVCRVDWADVVGLVLETVDMVTVAVTLVEEEDGVEVVYGRGVLAEEEAETVEVEWAAVVDVVEVLDHSLPETH